MVGACKFVWCRFSDKVVALATCRCQYGKAHRIAVSQGLPVRTDKMIEPRVNHQLVFKWDTPAFRRLIRHCPFYFERFIPIMANQQVLAEVWLLEVDLRP